MTFEYKHHNRIFHRNKEKAKEGFYGGVDGYKATSQPPRSSDDYVRGLRTVVQYAFIST